MPGPRCRCDRRENRGYEGGCEGQCERYGSYRDDHESKNKTMIGQNNVI